MDLVGDVVDGDRGGAGQGEREDVRGREVEITAVLAKGRGEGQVLPETFLRKAAGRDAAESDAIRGLRPGRRIHIYVGGYADRIRERRKVAEEISKVAGHAGLLPGEEGAAVDPD
jgi:hypothetical protein